MFAVHLWCALLLVYTMAAVVRQTCHRPPLWTCTCAGLCSGRSLCLFSGLPRRCRHPTASSVDREPQQVMLHPAFSRWLRMFLEDLKLLFFRISFNFWLWWIPGWECLISPPPRLHFFFFFFNSTKKDASFSLNGNTAWTRGCTSTYASHSAVNLLINLQRYFCSLGVPSWSLSVMHLKTPVGNCMMDLIWCL